MEIIFHKFKEQKTKKKLNQGKLSLVKNITHFNFKVRCSISIIGYF